MVLAIATLGAALFRIVRAQTKSSNLVKRKRNLRSTQPNSAQPEAINTAPARRKGLTARFIDLFLVAAVLVTLVLTAFFISLVVWPALEDAVGTRSAILSITLAVSLTVLLILALIRIPSLQAQGSSDSQREGDRLSNENEARATLAQIIGGLFLFVGVVFTWQQVSHTATEVRIAQEGQITERFTRAIDQLSSEGSLDAQLGGVYALERIAGESERDYWPVIQVLTAHLRERPQVTGQVGATPALEDLRAPALTQAILNVLTQRKSEWDNGRSIDLRGADLQWALLARINLVRADLSTTRLAGADLTAAILAAASLTGADLGGANLTRATLRGADLTDSDLSGALLTGASLRDAELSSANLTDTVLVQTCLHGANMGSAVGLTRSVLATAFVTPTTVLPENLRANVVPTASECQ